MPISDDYVVSFLVQETQAARLRWRRVSGGEFDGYAAQLNGVGLRFTRVDSSTESRLWLEMVSSEGSALVAEPRGFGLWGRRYRTAAEEALARVMTQLEEAVAGEVARRAVERTDSALRQALFRRILFPDPVTE